MRRFFSNRQLKYDYLTKLYDREVVSDYAKFLMEKNRKFSLAIIDVDNFKNVNDGYGHILGDKVICYVAEQIKKAFEGIGVVGRCGGDEFMVIIKDIVDYDEVWNMCKQAFSIIDGIEIPEHESIFITVTLGLSRFPEDGNSYDDIYLMADKALYRGKLKGRSCFVIYLKKKHKDIKFDPTKDTSLNSLQLHASVFRNLTKTDDLSLGIKNLFKFLGTNLMLDHICIQVGSELIFSEIHALSRSKNFNVIPLETFVPNIWQSRGVYYVNDINQLIRQNQKELEKSCRDQSVFSIFFAEIAYNDKVYGYLRADATSCARVWQFKEMNLLVTAANTIALLLHYQNKDFSLLAK